ncbi:MAG: ribbon-helix-helix domain-containing protein [Methylococcales bacterium]
MNISLPDTLKAFVDTQVQDRGYGTASEYVRDLIRNDQIRQGEQRLAELMLESLESGPAMPADADYWDNKRSALARRHSVR